MKSGAEKAGFGSVERAQRQLRALIAHGHLLPGQQIRQIEMAEEFGISRVPLREALTILADQGLLEHHLNRGYFVAKRLPVELHQLSRMLDILEGELHRSMDWPSREELGQLRMINRQMKGAAEKVDLTEIIVLNREFHFKIFNLTHYKIILREVERLWAMTDIYIAGKLALPEARQRAVQEHDQIIGALAQRDKKAFERAVEIHRLSRAAEGLHTFGVMSPNVKKRSPTLRRRR